MQNKRDQVQAHLFVMGRLASAMLRADPDDPESPSGRTSRGAAIGLIIALLVCAGAFVLGLIRPGGNTTWKSEGQLVADKQTGASYLYLNGRLRPVRNYASARLITGGAPESSSVGTSSLNGTPHGTPVGIPGAPAALPGTGDLDTGPWLVCSATEPTETGTPRARTALAIGAGEVTDIPGARRLDTRTGVLVAGPEGGEYLLWRGTRLRLDEDADAVRALGYGSVTPRPVSAAFLDAFPQGPDLAPPEVPGRGEDGPRLGDRATRVGQVFRVDVPGSDPRYHVLREEGLVPLSDTAAALLLGDPRTAEEAYGGGEAQVTTLGADALTGHLAPDSAGRGEETGLPPTPPEPARGAAGEVVCADITSTGSRARVGAAVLPGTVLTTPAQGPEPEFEPACLPVDTVFVRPGAGVLVRALSTAGTPLGDTAFLVTDTGVKHRLLSQEAVEALGYGEAREQTLPAHVLAMLPTGPDLTKESATTGEPRISVRCARPDGEGE
ncbi:type VII secretion protein EccB [Streptomyces sp. NEAU-W12]|uniref:type VII secretion protein EccB n=1 Tax=Streptomyces sp. NEAU-W12 TaxID=2994668 RepID=UPI00224A6F9F|nr:type VII secretion protein EccB [Streptomyces sp. NEAU-W12]MCX2923468.1 type VII secretion protein EccB [Streptomyces sp. NEAU-W12]